MNKWLILAACAGTDRTPSPGAALGTLTGTVEIGPLCPVEPCEPFANPYESRELLLGQGGKVVARVPLNSDGSFEQQAPVGRYSVEVSECDFLRCGAELPVDTTIDSGKTTTLTIRIDTGIRSPVGVPQGRGKEVTFEELFASPERYNGAEVVLTGFYFHGWETIVLSERLDPTGRVEGHLWPQGRKVWIEGDLVSADVYDQPHGRTQNDMTYEDAPLAIQ